jgi:hypothetical protein
MPKRVGILRPDCAALLYGARSHSQHARIVGRDVWSKGVRIVDLRVRSERAWIVERKIWSQRARVVEREARIDVLQIWIHSLKIVAILMRRERRRGVDRPAKYVRHRRRHGNTGCHVLHRSGAKHGRGCHVLHRSSAKHRRWCHVLHRSTAKRGRRRHALDRSSVLSDAGPAWSRLSIGGIWNSGHGRQYRRRNTYCR